MRFYVPNKEEDSEKEDDKKMKDGEKKEGEGEEDEEEEDEITPAKVFNDQILKYAGLGEKTGTIVASFHDLSLQVPRGKYTLDMFETFAKFHGRTHDYKIMYKDIKQVFQLPRIDRESIVILIQLSKPLNQGNTMHNFIMVQLDKDAAEMYKVNQTPEEMNKKFGGSINEDEPLHLILAKMLRLVASIDRIIIPGDFKSGLDDKSQAISCSVKVSEGFLYPLKTSLIFIQKPIIYIKHKEIKYVEFSRIGSTTGGTGRSFDFVIAKLESESTADHAFKNVDKKELKALMKYFKDAGIKMRQIDSDTNKAIDLNDFNTEELDEEIRQS
jgi:structure-specific recognition protein 1